MKISSFFTAGSLTLLPATIFSATIPQIPWSTQQIQDFQAKIKAQLSNFQAQEPDIYNEFMTGMNDIMLSRKGKALHPEQSTIDGLHLLEDVMVQLKQGGSSEDTEIFDNLMKFFKTSNQISNDYKNWVIQNEPCKTCGVSYPGTNVFQDGNTCYFPCDVGANTFSTCQDGLAKTTYCPKGYTYAEDPQQCIDGAISFYEYEDLYG